MTVSSTSTNALYSVLSETAQNSSLTQSDPLISASNTSQTDLTQLLSGSSSTQSSGLSTDMQNGTNSLGMMQIAEKALSSLASSGKQLSAISTQLNNTSLSSDQQTQLQQQAASLTQSMQQTLNDATFNGQSVFGNYSTSIGGIDLSAGATAPDLSKLDVTDSQSISNFLNSVSTTQKSLGSQIVNISNSMMSSITQSMFQSIDGSSTSDSTDFFNQAALALPQNTSSLDAQSIAQAHDTSNIISPISSLLG